MVNSVPEDSAALIISLLRSSQRACDTDYGRGSAPGGLLPPPAKPSPPSGGRLDSTTTTRSKRGFPSNGGQEQGRPGNERGHHHYAAHPPSLQLLRKPQPGSPGEGGAGRGGRRWGRRPKLLTAPPNFSVTGGPLLPASLLQLRAQTVLDLRSVSLSHLFPPSPQG